MSDTSFRYDAIVVGLGAAGSATLYQLAKRGARVLGIDRFSPPHAFGSSSGETRVTRKAIVTGGLWISSAARQAETHAANFFDNTLAAARRFGIGHELLDAAAMRRRFPQFDVRDNETGYYEPDAGYLRPEACVRAQLELARRHGAEIRFDHAVESLDQLPPAGNIILAAGAWLPRLLPPELARLFTVTRQVQYWFEVTGAPERASSSRPSSIRGRSRPTPCRSAWR